MSNINRDYLCILDVKTGAINTPKMYFYNTDRSTSNIYVQLVVKETIVSATPIENATDFAVELKVVKSGNVVKFMDGVLVNEAEAIYEFDLPEDFTNLSGNYDIEFWVKAKVNNRDEMITSSKAKYTVKPSILTDLDEAIEDSDDYPLLLKLIDNVKQLDANAQDVINRLEAVNDEMKESIVTMREMTQETIAVNEEARAVNAELKANEEVRKAEHEEMKSTINNTLNSFSDRVTYLEENDTKLSDRMTKVEISDKRQYVIMEGLMNSAGDGYLKIEDTGNDTTLYNSVEGFVDVKNITGNTMVNSIKNPDDELTLNADINTSGQSVTLTTAVDNGQVDVLAEGNTMVNVCDQREAIAITKSYTVETGNHIALQGDYDGKCRPVPTGNTLWIDNDTGEVLTAFDNTKNLRLQSSFEDKLVTQEMVDNGEELAENLGKYRVDYKVTGKNKFDGQLENGSYNSSGDKDDNPSTQDIVRCKNYIPVNPNTNYKSNYNLVVYEYNKDKNFIRVLSIYNDTRNYTTSNNCAYIRFRMPTATSDLNANIQIEEGSTATACEPYKESIKTYYLNSPLLEGDTIEENSGNVYHIHRSNKIYIDGVNRKVTSMYTTPSGDNNFVVAGSAKVGTLIVDKNPSAFAIGGNIDFRPVNIGLSFGNKDEANQYFVENPTTIVYSIASPTEELISQSDTILTDSYVAGHLDFDTAVLIDRVEFKNVILENKYLYANTAYTVQFEADSVGIANITLGGATLASASVVKGINKVSITTPDTLADNNLVLDGIGFSASNIVVTEATDKDFGYFSGMKSVGELEENKIEILSQNCYNYINVNDVEFSGADRISNLYIEVFEGEKLTSTSTKSNGWMKFLAYDENKKYLGIYGNKQGTKTTIIIPKNVKYIRPSFNIVAFSGSPMTYKGDKDLPYEAYKLHAENKKQILLNEPLRAVGDTKDRFVQIDGKWYVEKNCTERNYETDDETNTSYKTDKIKTVYTLPSPTYEPVEIAPTVNTYTDVTHITNNSTIPMNMPIVNSGYEVIARPSTKYTVVGITNGRIGDSTIVNGTITTPATITDNFLRPYGTGKTSKVMLLEGEPANIPGYFKGIKSVFEDKVTEDGKYACKVRVYNDLGEETVQTLYLDEPLYNANNITIYNDKLGYWKNWDSVTLDGSDDENWQTMTTNNGSNRFTCSAPNNMVHPINDFSDATIISNLLPSSASDNWLNSEGICTHSSGAIIIYIKLINDINSFKQYLSQNPVTVVYQLAEPEFVPLIDNCPNWVIGSWDNCSIHFDSIIPLKDTRYRYTGNVPSVVAMSEDIDTVSSISDEQDALLIDMATELAVMKLTM